MHNQNDHLHSIGVCACRSIQPQKSLLGEEYKTSLPAQIAGHMQGKRSLYGTVKWCLVKLALVIVCGRDDV
jgi:hypothetical protein